MNPFRPVSGFAACSAWLTRPRAGRPAAGHDAHASVAAHGGEAERLAAAYARPSTRRKLESGRRLSAVLRAFAQSQPRREVMQVAAVHPQRAGGGCPVAVMPRDRIGDDAPLELGDLIAE